MLPVRILSTRVLPVVLILIAAWPVPLRWPEETSAAGERPPPHVVETADAADIAAAAIERIASLAGPERDFSSRQEPAPTLAIAAASHRVRARGYVLAEVDGHRQWIIPTDFPGCTAVSLGGGRFVTVGHLTQGLGGKIEVDVQVDGRWVNNAAQTPVPGRDLLYLAIPAAEGLSSVETRSPAHYDEVTLFGLQSAKPQVGIFAGDRHVALTPDEPGITFGDSGGGVFGRDGKLLGVIQGFGSDGERSVYIVPLENASPVPAVNEPPRSPPAREVMPRRSCPGGSVPWLGQAPRGPVACRVRARRGPMAEETLPEPWRAYAAEWAPRLIAAWSVDGFALPGGSMRWIAWPAPPVFLDGAVHLVIGPLVVSTTSARVIAWLSGEPIRLGRHHISFSDPWPSLEGIPDGLRLTWKTPGVVHGLLARAVGVAIKEVRIYRRSAVVELDNYRDIILKW